MAATASRLGDVMHGSLLQDWVTIRLGGPTSVSQGADQWLDVGDHEDVVLTLDVREVSNMTVYYDTSPTAQENSFAPMLSRSTTLSTLAIGTTVDRVYSSLAAVPVARFVRWRLGSTSAGGDITFRIWVASYAWVRA